MPEFERNQDLQRSEHWRALDYFMCFDDDLPSYSSDKALASTLKTWQRCVAIDFILRRSFEKDPEMFFEDKDYIFLCESLIEDPTAPDERYKGLE